MVTTASGWAQKPLLTFTPTGAEDERPVITSLVMAPQGSDYALKLEFNREPSGDACQTRCANATVFLDTDNSKNTGLKLADPAAQETGADLAIVIQSVREIRESGFKQVLKVKILQYDPEATTVDATSTLAELNPTDDAERLMVDGKSVLVLVDSNLGSSSTVGPKARVVYHPAGSKALVGVGKGLAAPNSGRVIELYKGGKLQNSPAKKKPAP